MKLSGKAARIIRKCTAFDPNNRYSDVSKVTAALQASVRAKVRWAIISAAAAAAILGFIALGSAYVLSKSSGSKEVVFSSPLMEQITQLYIC